MPGRKAASRSGGHSLLPQALGGVVWAGPGAGGRHDRLDLAPGGHPAPRPQGAVGMVLTAPLGLPEAVHEVELVQGGSAAPTRPCRRPGGASRRCQPRRRPRRDPRGHRGVAHWAGVGSIGICPSPETSILARPWKTFRASSSRDQVRASPIVVLRAKSNATGKVGTASAKASTEARSPRRRQSTTVRHCAAPANATTAAAKPDGRARIAAMTSGRGTRRLGARRSSWTGVADAPR